MAGLTHIGAAVAGVRDELQRSVQYEALTPVSAIADSISISASIARAHLANGKHALAASEVAKLRAGIARLVEIAGQLGEAG